MKGYGRNERPDERQEEKVVWKGSGEEELGCFEVGLGRKAIEQYR